MLIDMKKLSIYLLSFVLLLWSCEQENIVLKPLPQTPTEAETPDKGNADFTKYIAVGNSLTAGFQAGALFTEGQENSLAAMLARQFEAVGGGEFHQPDINSENGFNILLPNSNPDFILGRLTLQGNPAAPAPTMGDAIKPYEGDKSKLNNFGVPGILLAQAMTPLTGGPDIPENPAFNALYARFASDPGNSTIMGDAVAANGTFFSFWLGNNDVLGYAASGATNEAIFTDAAVFKIQYHAALEALLTDPNIKGVVANIPDVTGIPYFTTVPYNAITLGQEQVDALNAGYAEFNQGIDAYNAGLLTGAVPDTPRPKISFEAGDNPIVIVDNDLADLTAYGIPSMRQMEEGELVIFTAATVLPTGVGSAEPAPDNLVLTKREIIEIKERVDAFNQAIVEVVDEIAPDRVAIVDINTAFKELAAGGAFQDGVVLTASLAPPFGAFSEDGIHPNTRGYAFTANLFIEAINKKFAANVPEINIAAYSGTGLPTP